MECKNCGKEFASLNGRQSYCSKECYTEYQKVLRAKRNENKQYFICSECGNTYKTFRGDNQHRICKDCIAKKSICKCGNKKSINARFCRDCGYKYQKQFTCIICGKESRGNSNQKVCEDCIPVCMLPGCNNKVSDYRHRVKTNNKDGLMFCCHDHWAQYQKIVGFKEGTPLGDQWKEIGSQKYNPYGEGAAKPRIKRLEKNGIEYETQFGIKNNIGLKFPKDAYKERNDITFPDTRVYDIKIGNILLEISPVVSHNSTYGHKFNKNKKGRHPLYHTYSQILAEANGYHCIQIFGFEDISKTKKRLLGLIKGRKSINARIVKKISYKEGNEFCIKNHLQGGTSAITNMRYGLFRSDCETPYAVMGFKLEKGKYTLQRFACLEGYHVPYGAYRMFKQFIKDYNPNYIISQSDSSKHNGKLYDSLGFERMGRTRDYRRYNIKSRKFYRRRNCQKNKAYKLEGFENHPKGDKYYSNNREHDIMINAGYVWLVTAGQVNHVRFNGEEGREIYFKENKPKDERKRYIAN